MHNSVLPKGATRVLFLAWGFSIHAKRRIQIFVEDSYFKVAVVSTHNYSFEDTMNVLLTGVHEDTERADCIVYEKGSEFAKSRLGFIRSNLGKILSAIKALLDIKTVLDAASILFSSDLFSEIKLKIKDCKVLTVFLLSPGIRCEIARAVKDLKILKSAVQQFQPDVVFLQTLLYPCYLAYLLPRSLPLIITLWNGDVIWRAEWSGIERLLKKQLVTYGMHRARSITVNSKKAFEACLGYDTQAYKIHLIRYPGVDLKRFRPVAKGEARRKLGITSQKVVLCPRGLGGYLNSDVIVEAIVSVVKMFPDTLFLFVSGIGGETELKKHQQRARELGIEKNIRWDGQVSWDMMSIYYSSSDVMVSISSNDSAPNCMFEAMACGVPLIIGDIPQLHEWIVDGVNGFLVPPRDPSALSGKILEALENSNGYIKSFTKRNLELVNRDVDSEKNAEQIKDLVHQVARYYKSDVYS